MPSNSNTDKQNDNLEQASKADKKFIAFKKRMFRLGVGFLIAAIALSLPNYFFLETSNNILGVAIFLFVVLADIFILLPAIITKETSWPALLGSTILCIVFLCLSVFYPFQHFQYRLKVISLVAIVATLLFVLLNNWINAAFFPSKNAYTRQSVDFASNRFAVDVLNVTLILGTLFGTIAFLYFYPGQDNSTFFGGIDIKNVALATAGLVTFFWAAKATKNKSIELEEKKQDGKRHDNEIKMAKQRDTAQLIAEASKLLSSENDTQKYAGLSFLNKIASDSEGTFRKEAFYILTDFIMDASDVTTANKVRMRAIYYADDLVGNNPDKFRINRFIQLLCPNFKKDYLSFIAIKNLYIVYIGFLIQRQIFKEIELRKSFQFAFIECIFDGLEYDEKIGEINQISAVRCKFEYCNIKNINIANFVFFHVNPVEKFIGINYLPDKYFNEGFKPNKFEKCDFSDCLSWINVRSWSDIKVRLKDTFDRCYYYSGHAPKDFDTEKYSDLLIEITSKEQFEELFKEERLVYSPPEDKK